MSSVFSQQSSQGYLFKAKVRPCVSSVQNLLTAAHLTQRKRSLQDPPESDHLSALPSHPSVTPVQWHWPPHCSTGRTPDFCPRAFALAFSSTWTYLSLDFPTMLPLSFAKVFSDPPSSNTHRLLISLPLFFSVAFITM